MPDDAVVTHLVAVKGIGTWTAHIFLMFHLHPPDVLPVGDLEPAARGGGGLLG
ncbi:hypothetical protein ACQPZA_23800 [Pseudonocardia xinjiangensis]|uniref:hypothetical protein n=1 Tax=Pseudonocardia xinjiangensis TaxID=75289 RepID=UPI003D932ECC